MKKEIKQLNTKHLREIISLHKRSIIPLWRKIGRAYSIKGIKEFVNLTFKKGKIFGYFIDKKLIGCIGVELDKKHKYADLMHILVDEKHQRKGMGRELMKYAENYAKKNKIKTARLHVLVKNRAINFYEKLGYKKHAYIIQKRLKRRTGNAKNF